MFPPLVLWHPELAESMLEYRMARVRKAEEKASSHGFKGAMFPWQSAESGAEETPTWSHDDVVELHITGDIAIAAQQYWYSTNNETWLRNAYPGLLQKGADFWVSRVTRDGNVAHIKDCEGPDEEHPHIDDSVYTNYLAQRALLLADETASLIGETSNPDWKATASQIPILFDSTRNIHPEYQGYNGDMIKQADVILLGFPLMMEMDPAVRRADLDYYAAKSRENSPAMTWSMHAVGYLELGDPAKADEFFDKGFQNNVHPPFNVWSEYPADNIKQANTANFLTGAGGFLQSAVYGLPGLRIWPDHLALKPSLTSGMTEVTVRGVHYRGSVMTITFDNTRVAVSVDADGEDVAVAVESGATTHITAGAQVSFPTGALKLTVPKKAEESVTYV
eukprot:TRINITY_DN23538_c0_g1_i4.p1 TRINITY_DN23538_c0_g1~~TRINITY_DN23538_c0_g1_i4.p1  ORF type:complete len:392 (-),score=63.17 TRINITY_DN23538_c0_g1_i4:378-1553(-)